MENGYSSTRRGKRCVIYIRVSLERQVEGFSLEGQEHSLKEWANFEGMSVLQTYVEAGRSGKSITGRETFQRMLDDIATGKVVTDYVLVYKMSRFGRNAKDVLVSLAFLQSHGVNLICQQDGIDSSTQMGRMMLTVLSAVAQMERENILAQTMLGREQKARDGGWNGGPPPYGYDLIDGRLVLKEDEASVVRMVFDEYINGSGYQAIVGRLNRLGIPRLPTKVSQGRPFTDWSIQQIKRMLDNPVYTGRIAFGKTRQERIKGTENEYRRLKSDNVILSEIAHEAIITDEVFEKAQARRREVGVACAPKVGRNATHLLTGLLKCPQCGTTMYPHVSRSKNRDGTTRDYWYYVCGHHIKSNKGQCQNNGINADWIETEVVEFTKLLVTSPQFAEDVQQQIGQKVDVSDIDAELTTLQTKLKKLERSKANLERDIDNIADEDRNATRKRRDMNNRLNKLYDDICDTEDGIAACEQKKRAVEQNVLTVENVYKMLSVFEELYDKMDAEDRQEVIRSLIAEVELYPKATWKKGKSPIKSIKYTFPVSCEVVESFCENESCVCWAV